MQLPRGNLETVSPRALVLAAIASSLQVPLLAPSSHRGAYKLIYQAALQRLGSQKWSAMH